MSFNVNFLGGIPYNPDNLHIPTNDQKGTPNIFPARASTRLLGFAFNGMFSTYWTVKSFEISVTARVIDNIDPFAQFIAGGGTSGGIIGSLAGVGSISQSQDGGIAARGYTKIYSRYTKRVRTKSLDLDENIEPNKLECFTYKPNEGTLCSAGPVHVFSKNNVSIIIDFSDIRYLPYRGLGLYWPNVTINVLVPTAGAAFGNTIPSIRNPSSSLGFGGGFSIINLNFPGAIANLGANFINSQISTNQIANVNIDIKPGKRCCDRFFWDGKDKEREEDSRTKASREDSEDTCNDVCGDDEEKGVYAKRIEKES